MLANGQSVYRETAECLAFRIEELLLCGSLVVDTVECEGEFLSLILRIGDLDNIVRFAVLGMVCRDNNVLVQLLW